ncbi:hypothetical protein [Dactylosporangium salmoneum]
MPDRYAGASWRSGISEFFRDPWLPVVCAFFLVERIELVPRKLVGDLGNALKGLAAVITRTGRATPRQPA